MDEYKTRKYTVVPYDPNWKKQFEIEAQILRLIFSDDAITIEHIGSTSVFGLAGKPVVDILILVEDISATDKVKEKMKNAGYDALGEYVTKGAQLFVRELDSNRFCNIHIFQKNHPHVQEMLRLRDYFRTHQNAVQEYSELKFDLAKKYPNDYGEYRKRKDRWMSELKKKVKTHFERRIRLGKVVSSENEKNWWKPELFEKNTKEQLPSELEIIAPPPEEELNYNCFVYALGLQNDSRFLGNGGWAFTRKLDVVFDEMIGKDILKSVDTPKEGDMIVYRADGGVISHAGLMENENMVISKWSWGPLLRHSIFDVPDHYGDKVEFYTFSDEARDFVFEKRDNNSV